MMSETAVAGWAAKTVAAENTMATAIGITFFMT
jgi:hypothetical protein